MKKLALILVLLVAAAVAAVYLIGALQPLGHVASSQIRLSQPPDEVWATVSDFRGWPGWNSAVQSVRRGEDRDGKPVWVVVGEWGDLPSIVEVFEPPGKMVTRIPEGAGLGFGGSWTYEIESDGTGSRVRITERGEVDSPLFRAMMLWWGQHETLEQFLRDLGKKFGETVEPERVLVPERQAGMSVPLHPASARSSRTASSSWPPSRAQPDG